MTFLHGLIVILLVVYVLLAILAVSLLVPMIWHRVRSWHADRRYRTYYRRHHDDG